MNKKIIIIIVSLVVLALAYWLISPFWRNPSLNEELPGLENTPSVSIKDTMETMDADTKIDFEKQTMEMKDRVMPMNDKTPENKPQIIAQADMVARAHDVEGTALIVKSGDETFLRFENLKTINGPALRIYLSSDLSEDDIVDLGPIRATEGNVNYPIPKGTDLSKYKNAMIWCNAFDILFSYAQF